MVTKATLVKKAAHKLNIDPKIAKQVVQALLDQILRSLSEGDRIELRNFGVLEVVKRKSKIGRNPQKPSVDIPIPARKSVKFKPGKFLG